jgi:hypothetical protein
MLEKLKRDLDHVVQSIGRVEREPQSDPQTMRRRSVDLMHLHNRRRELETQINFIEKDKNGPQN